MTAFATAADIAKRLSRAAYTGTDLEQVNLLIELASGAVLDAVGKDETWADAQTTVPAALRSVCIEAVVRVLINPSGARSESETLGAYQHSTSFRDDTGGLVLSDAEQRRARRALYGAGSGSARVGAIIDEVADNALLDARYASTTATTEG